MSISKAETARDLRAAAGVIVTGGLARQTYDSPEGGHCMIGALRRVARTGWSKTFLEPGFEVGRVHAGQRVLADLLGAPEGECPADGYLSGPGFRAITEFNDDERHSAADVVRLLEQAAEKLEADL